MFKKLLLGLGIAGLLGVWSFGLVSAQGTPDTSPSNFGSQGFGSLGSASWLGVEGAGTEKGDGLITVIKKFVNRILGLLALITLVIVLRGGFKMVTAAGDEGKFKEWFKILKQAGIGLAVIGLSWFVVSIIFRVISGSTSE